MQIKPSHMLAIVAWASVFLEAWLFIKRQIERDPLNWTFFVFFLLIAIFSSAIASSKK